MSRNHVSPASFTSLGQFVNVSIAALAVIVIGVGYLSALGSFAGVA
ncbi:hypothetical protein [Amphiplicatus metriothermophilus]|uniref:Uncharacterized protein n=1 Tax=Amphiplicatus metriothermophilus TaxID=1519374 RepID=A0A239PL73_9PROT|nr:hypothetical protein [Amphiplicatus metriothermophilus]MBB5517587.1 hypothetical protein [Amphiplicatus metriothermophilus]SNT68079.1 hypothetical protein SAMN06297382_0575 [Amphiplicatus metriothermophilus]